MICLGSLWSVNANKAVVTAHKNDASMRLPYGEKRKQMHQCNCSSGRLIIGIAFVVFLTGNSLAQEKTDWKDRFFAEAPKHWEEYVRFARTLQITGKWNRYKGANRITQVSGRTEFKQTKGASLSVIYLSNGEAEAEGTNPSYSFNLKRRGPDKGWIITDLKVSDQSTDFSDDRRELQERRLQQVCACLRLEALWLPTLIHDPDFRITAVKPQEVDGRPVIRFDFDYPKSDEDYPRRGALHIKGGWMVLDPEHDWVLREYVVHTGEPEKNYSHQIFQFREGADRHPIITHAADQVFNKEEKQFEMGPNVEAQWEVVERSDVPLEEFTLTAFGLAEPPGIRVERSSRLYLWIALGGIVCLGIAALIRWQIRRRRTAA